MLKPSANGHSAKVEMRLHVAGDVLPVVQASQSAIKLQYARRLGSGPATLEIVVDGAVRREPVQILWADINSRWVRIS
ncbi:hypothetical protein [Fontivita pretiosa]|uniref:hypothetical protein n=1 Tax=Fontivita pretiosa TaxID=2989684 RepID=UPI003D185543